MVLSTFIYNIFHLFEFSTQNFAIQNLYLKLLKIIPDDYYDPKEDQPKMKQPKIKYHPTMSASQLIDNTKIVGHKNWLNLQCGK